MTLEPATSDWLPAIQRALEEAGLPASDLQAPMLRHFLIGIEGEGVALCVGMGPFGKAGLLRSLAVAEGRRGAGEGSRLLAAAEFHARGLGIESLWLLTTTAVPFFSRHGYALANRASAPEAMRRSAEFTSLCPASAACMSRRIVEGEA